MTLVAAVLSLCTAGVAAPTIAAAAGPAQAPTTAIAQLTEDTSNTIRLAHASLRIEPGRNELVVTSVSGDDIARLRAALGAGGRLAALTVVTPTQTAVLEGASASRLTDAEISSAVSLSLNFDKIEYRHVL
jgi:hypothetical protein